MKHRRTPPSAGAEPPVTDPNPHTNEAARAAWWQGYDSGIGVAVRQIRGRLFEAAWRKDSREWLDPKETSRILDEVEAAARDTEDGDE